jgi:hypothetical protein
MTWLSGCQLDDALRASPRECQPSATMAVAVDHVADTFDAWPSCANWAQAGASTEHLRIGQLRYERARTLKQ